MNYLLHRINLQLQAYSNEQCHNKRQILLKQALNELHCLESGLLLYLAGLSSKEQLSIALNAITSNCTLLLNTFYYSNRQSRSNITMQEREFRHKLLQLHSFIRSQYTTHFNHEIPVPVCCKNNLAATWNKKQYALIQALRHKGHSAKLLGIVSRTISCLLQQREASWKQLYWILHCIKQLRKTATINSGANDWLLIKWLAVNGYNKPSFIQYMFDFCKTEALSNASIKEQLNYWAAKQKQFVFLTTFATTSLFTCQPSVQHAITTLIEQETTTLTKILNDQMQQPQNITINTVLSVPQLAVFLKLLISTGIIRHNNQAELLRLVTTIVRTNKATAISHESLRNKYYAQEPAAANIVKDYLFNMLKQLK